jgi:hypothetical protein
LLILLSDTNFLVNKKVTKKIKNSIGTNSDQKNIIYSLLSDAQSIKSKYIQIENKTVSKKNKTFFNDFLSLKNTKIPKINELTKGNKWE